MEEYLKFALEIAREAGTVMRKYFEGDNGANYKYDQTIVTKADKEINHRLIECVKEHFPDHSVDGEEEQFGKSRYVWVCDPVDGTAMYARHIPVAVFSLALVIDGEPVLGVVYDPFLDNMYQAVKGGGAYKNGEPVHVNDIPLCDQRSMSNFDIFAAAEYDLLDVMRDMIPKTYFVGMGSAIHAGMCVANGDFNVTLFPGTLHKNCDVAATKIIVEEAGGRVTDLFGNEQRYDTDINGAIVSNGIVHEDVVAIVKKYLTNKK